MGWTTRLTKRYPPRELVSRTDIHVSDILLYISNNHRSLYNLSFNCIVSLTLNLITVTL